LLKAHRTFSHVSSEVRDAKIGLPVVMLAASSALRRLVLQRGLEGMYWLLTEATDALRIDPSRIPALLKDLSASRSVL
jgi:hypothetical protein